MSKLNIMQLPEITKKKRVLSPLFRKPKRYTEDELKARRIAYKKTKVQWFVVIEPSLKEVIDKMKKEVGIKKNEHFVEWLLERGQRSLDRKNAEFKN